MGKVEHKGSENLIPYKKGDSKGKSEAGKIGGIKSGESKRQKKLFKDILEEILEKPYKKNKKYVIDENGEKITFKQAVAAKAVESCIKGNIKGMVFVRDTLGEKPTDKIESTNINAEVDIDKIKELRKQLNDK